MTVCGKVALVVEDEPLVAMMACDTLEGLGYTVFEARTLGEATAILSEERGVSLLFTDIELADGSSGIDLARHVSAGYPEIRIVITSGRGGPNVVPLGAFFIPKPYAQQHLASALRQQSAR